MSIRNRPKTGVGATRKQVQGKLLRVGAGRKPAGVKTVKAAKAAAAAVTLKSNRERLPVRKPKMNETPNFLSNATARSRVTGGVFGTQHA